MNPTSTLVQPSLVVSGFEHALTITGCADANVSAPHQRAGFSSSSMTASSSSVASSSELTRRPLLPFATFAIIFKRFRTLGCQVSCLTRLRHFPVSGCPFLPVAVLVLVAPLPSPLPSRMTPKRTWANSPVGLRGSPVCRSHDCQAPIINGFILHSLRHGR